MALERRTLILAKKETTYGTDASPSASTDAIEIFDLDVNVNIDTIERKPYKDNISPEASLAGKKFCEISFDVEIKGNGSQQDGTTAPRYTRLLEACGMSIDATAESGAGTGDGFFEIKPTSSNFASLTIYAYLDDTLYKITGARGDLQVVTEANQIGKFKFKFQGMYSRPIKASMPSATFETMETPPLCKNAQLTMGGTFSEASGNTPPSVSGGFAPILSAFEVGLNNALVQRDDLNAEEGVGDININERGTAGSINPDAMDLDTYNIWEKFEAGEEETIWARVGSNAGNIVEIFVPKAVYSEVKPGARDGVRIYDVSFTAVGDNDEVRIVLR